MLLQVALDVVDAATALRLASLVGPEVDRIEVGTPLLLSSGASVIEAIRARVPNAVIVADCKTMDCGAKLASLVMARGANGLIVQGAAPTATVRSASATVERYGGFMMVDDLGVDDLTQLATKLVGLPVAELIVHTGKDDQAEGRTPAVRLREASEIQGLPPLAVAGGVNQQNFRTILGGAVPAVLIVGEAIYGHRDPVSVARGLRLLMDELATHPVERSDTR